MRHQPPRHDMLKSLTLLSASLLSGSLIGWAGRQATGHEAWFLAAPLLLSLAWWRVSSPARSHRADASWRRASPAARAKAAVDTGPPTEPMPSSF